MQQNAKMLKIVAKNGNAKTKARRWENIKSHQVKTELNLC